MGGKYSSMLRLPVTQKATAALEQARKELLFSKIVFSE
jgi:hypothetical protein